MLLLIHTLPSYQLLDIIMSMHRHHFDWYSVVSSHAGSCAWAGNEAVWRYNHTTLFFCRWLPDCSYMSSSLCSCGHPSAPTPQCMQPWTRSASTLPPSSTQGLLMAVCTSSTGWPSSPQLHHGAFSNTLMNRLS